MNISTTEFVTVACYVTISILAIMGVCTVIKSKADRYFKERFGLKETE